MPIPPFRYDGWLPVGHHVATWDEIVERFGGEQGSQSASLTDSLLRFRNALRGFGVSGTLIIDGSYISLKADPKDFDVLLIGTSDLQERKDREPLLGDLWDAEKAEKLFGYSLFYTTADSPVLGVLRDLWSMSKELVPKGVVEVAI